MEDDQKPQPVKIFYCYARQDKNLRDRLAVYLEPLRRCEEIITWYDREISPGKDFRHEIMLHLDTSDIILALVSPSFLASDYCQNIEMCRALERHALDDTRIVPIILDDCLWKDTTIGDLQVLPSDGRPLSFWTNKNKGLIDITHGITKVVKEIQNGKSKQDRKKSIHHTNLGWQLLEAPLGYYVDEALSYFKVAIRYDNTNIDAWAGLLEAWQYIGDHEKILTVCNHMIRMYVDNKEKLLLPEPENIRKFSQYALAYEKKYALLELLDMKEPLLLLDFEIKCFYRDYNFVENECFKINYKGKSVSEVLEDFKDFFKKIDYEGI